MAENSQAICDAGPLIHLDELSTLDLLSDFGFIIVPQEVWIEVERNRPNTLISTQVSLTRVNVQVEIDPAFDTLAQALSLGAGERAAIRLAHHQNSILLTDDAAARLAAEGLGLRVHGTIGVLIRGIRRGQKTPSEIIDILKSLPTRSSLHIRAELLASIIRQLNNEFGLL